MFVADMSTAETGDPGTLLGVELHGGRAAVDFLPQSTDFDGESALMIHQARAWCCDLMWLADICLPALLQLCACGI